MAPLVSSTSSLAAHAALRSAVQAPSPQAQLAALQKEYRALGPDGPSTVAAARQDGVGCTDDRTDLEVEREAERVVKAHFGLLHSYNEVRDAVENMIDKYGALVGRTANELKIDLGLTNDD